MKTVTVNGSAAPVVLDQAIRNALGAKTTGISSGGGTIRAHLVADAAIADEQTAQTVLENYGALTVTSDKAQITANGTDTATITYNTGSANVDWFALLDGEEYASGNEAAAGGVVTLTLATEIAGTYRVYIVETSGNYGTGYVQIGAV